jgi:hypothetical protein
MYAIVEGFPVNPDAARHSELNFDVEPQEVTPISQQGTSEFQQVPVGR